MRSWSSAFKNDRPRGRGFHADLAHLALIGATLRATGQPFANRTDAIRYALATVAATVAASAGDVQ